MLSKTIWFEILCLVIVLINVSNCSKPDKNIEGIWLHRSFDKGSPNKIDLGISYIDENHYSEYNKSFGWSYLSKYHIANNKLYFTDNYIDVLDTLVTSSPIGIPIKIISSDSFQIETFKRMATYKKIEIDNSILFNEDRSQPYLDDYLNKIIKDEKSNL